MDSKFLRDGDGYGRLVMGEHMTEKVTIEGKETIKEEPVLVVPNRVDEVVVSKLEEILGGMQQIVWLVQDELLPTAEVLRKVGRKGSRGLTFSPRRQGAEGLHEQIRMSLESKRHVVLLPGKPIQPPAHHADVPPNTLNYLLGEYTRAVMPIYVGMYKDGDEIVNGAPYDEIRISILPAFTAKGDGAARVGRAWAEVAVEQICSLEEQRNETLRGDLLRSLSEHPEARVTDGVDEQSMSYRRLLALAIPVARRLRRHHSVKRLGIILPPGRFAVIANVACILAGITPINIDYNYTQQEFSAVTQQTGLTLFVTGSDFRQKQLHFPWPPKRDLLLIEEMLEPEHNFIKYVRDKMVNIWGKRWIAAQSGKEERGAQKEALMVFSVPEEGIDACGVQLSHRAVLTGFRLTTARLSLQPGQRVLSSMPLYHREGLLLGLIYPLLRGQDIITYPEPDAAKRLCTLVRRYKPSVVPLDARQLSGILACVHENDFGETSHILVTGRLTEEIAQRAYREHGMCLCACYFPMVCAMPVACSIRPGKEGTSYRAIPCGGVGCVGMVMPGTAVKIMNGEKEVVTGERGHLWVKCAAPFTAFAGEEQPKNLHGWVCTGDIAAVRADGLLVIGGSQTGFSCIDGEFISHAQAEDALCKLLKVDSADNVPKLAVVGVPSPDGKREELVLLSTLHKSVGPHDVLTTRYALANARYSTKLAPQRILAMRKIPTLRGGGVDYNLCRQLARKKV